MRAPPVAREAPGVRVWRPDPAAPTAQRRDGWQGWPAGRGRGQWRRRRPLRQPLRRGSGCRCAAQTAHPPAGGGRAAGKPGCEHGTSECTTPAQNPARNFQTNCCPKRRATVQLVRQAHLRQALQQRQQVGVGDRRKVEALQDQRRREAKAARLRPTPGARMCQPVSYPAFGLCHPRPNRTTALCHHQHPCHQQTGAPAPTRCATAPSHRVPPPPAPPCGTCLRGVGPQQGQA